MHKQLWLPACVCMCFTFSDVYAEDAAIDHNNDKVFSADTIEESADTQTGTEPTTNSNTLDELERSVTLSGSAAWSTLDTHPRYGIVGFLGFQNDTLDWTVKLGSATEKTSWDISSLQLGFEFHADLSEDLHLYLNLRQSLNHDGDADNSLSSPSNSYAGKSEEGSFQRFSLGARYSYSLNDRWSLGPHIAYFQSDQEYQFTNSAITGPSVDAATDELDSRFDTNWNGMIIGAHAQLVANEQWSVLFNLDISLLDYEADGRLNLRPDLKRKSFAQSGDGIGLDLGVKGIYKHNEHLHIHAFFSYSDWNVDGREKRYPSGGGSVDSDLDEAHFTSLLLGGGVRYAF